MSVPDYAHGIKSSFLETMAERAHAARMAQATKTVQTVQVTPGATAAQAGTHSTFLDDVLDVINPLQHIPVVSTLYRAATGDRIGDVERVAGDTLYGGLMGLGSSLANLIFKNVTGKDFGDTVLSWLDGGDTASNPTAVAAASAPEMKIAAAEPSMPPRSLTAPARANPAPAAMLADPNALIAALNAKGIDPALGMRAMTAYQASLGLGGGTAAGAGQP